MRGVFQNDALATIWAEIELMLEKDEESIGIAFDDPVIRRSIWTSYVHEGCLMGKSRQYPKDLWPDICLSMRLIGRLSLGRGWERVVSLHEGSVGTWILYLCPDPDGSLTTLEQIFHRVDGVFSLLSAPLDEIQ